MQSPLRRNMPQRSREPLIRTTLLLLPTRILPRQRLRYPRPCLNQSREINTSFNTRIVEHIHQVLSGDVPLSPRCKWTSSQAAYTAVEHAHSALVCLPNIGGALAV